MGNVFGTHRIIECDDGAQLAVWATDETDGHTILLVHGFSLDHTTWVPLAEPLVRAGHRVVAADLRGHGESTLGSALPTADRLVADIARIIDALDLESVHLVGHSLGAVIALAARVDDRMSATIITVTSIAGTEQSIQNPVMRLGARLFSSAPGIWLLRRTRPGRLMISTWFGKQPSTADMDWIRTLSANCPRPTRSAIAKATGDLDLRPTFTKTGPPTLVLCGRDDKATPLKFSERIAAAISDAHLVVIDDSGHMVIIEQPERVADELLGWIESER